MARIFFFLYLAFVILAAFVGFIDPPGQKNCGETWCGMASFLVAFAAGLPLSYIALPFFGEAAYFGSWLCIALNVFLLYYLLVVPH